MVTVAAHQCLLAGVGQLARMCGIRHPKTGIQALSIGPHHSQFHLLENCSLQAISLLTKASGLLQQTQT